MVGTTGNAGVILQLTNILENSVLNTQLICRSRQDGYKEHKFDNKIDEDYIKFEKMNVVYGYH